MRRAGTDQPRILTWSMKRVEWKRQELKLIIEIGIEVEGKGTTKLLLLIS
jgi:hypothetical protein